MTSNVFKLYFRSMWRSNQKITGLYGMPNAEFRLIFHWEFKQ